jgi:glutamate-1-semialdehyde 2,1-aminomutase
VPLFFKDGYGCRLQDVDNNEYIDYTLAWGPNILGYRHPKIVDAVQKIAEGPHTYGAQHELEYQVAEKIQEIVPCAERVAFTSSGSEAVQLALRLARAFTSRNLILKLEGHYHGWMDSILLSYHPGPNEAGPSKRPCVAPGSRGQVPNAADNMRVEPWNRIDLLEEAFRLEGSSIAAVIMEPVLCNSGCILPLEGYLAGVKNLCKQYGALLIFDEIITGFRMATGGAQQVYEVVPDLATFGKALGGGLPLSAVAGRKEILSLMFGGGVAFGGTFNGNPLSLAAAHATLQELSQDGGALLVRANRIGQGLQQRIREAAERHALPVLITGFGTAFALHHTPRAELREYRDTFEDGLEFLSRFLMSALAEGVYLLPDGRFYVSAVHSESDVEETLEKLEEVFRKVR